MKVTKAVSWTMGKLSMPGQNLCQVIIAVLSKCKFLAGGNLLRGKQLQPLFPRACRPADGFPVSL